VPVTKGLVLIAAEVQIVPFDIKALPAVPGAGTPEVCSTESGKVIPADPLMVIGIIYSPKS
jgi:hypothetical protein